MNSNIEFKPWPKIPRAGKGGVLITEKIDGTNGCIIIGNGVVLGVQSRNRFITPEADNMGFANWVYDNQYELGYGLGDGYHYGEWAGPGIQKNPHGLATKTFFLFDNLRWNDVDGVPNLCSVVPRLYLGPRLEGIVDLMMDSLQRLYDVNPGTPEGIIIEDLITHTREKVTFKHSTGKWNTPS